MTVMGCEVLETGWEAWDSSVGGLVPSGGVPAGASNGHAACLSGHLADLGSLCALGHGSSTCE